MKNLNRDIGATWHTPQKHENIGLHTVSYCTMYLCLERKGQQTPLMTLEFCFNHTIA